MIRIQSPAERRVAAAIVSIALMGCQPSANEPATSVKNEPSANSTLETKASDDPAHNASSNANPAIEALASLDFSSAEVVHHDDSGRVKVQLNSAWSDDGLLVVRAVFTPDDRGFHLYSSALPPNGVNGIGRPTLVEVAEPDRFQEAGPLASDKTPYEKVDPILNVSLSVYANGPVTLYLPLRFRETPQTSTQIPLKLTYMACGDDRCNSPVEGAVEQITATPR